MMKSSLSIALLGIGLSAVAGCDALGGADAPELTTENARATAVWHPHPINPALCHNHESPPSRPPRPNGCDIEVRLTAMTFETGQGVSEGRAELSGEFTAHPMDAAPGTGDTVVDVAEEEYTVGQANGLELDLGTYHVPTGGTRYVQVCSSFVEADSGLNGKDEYANGCVNLELTCDASTGQPSFERGSGKLDLCNVNGCNGSVSAEFSVKAADADMDGVPNDDDFTPELCDEENKAQGGMALLLYFDYNDNPLITLGQSLWTDLATVYSAYDYVVLVADNQASNPGGTSNAAWDGADRVFPPTRQGLLDAMQHLTSRGYKYDTFVHAHGYTMSDPADSEFETLPNSGGYISGAWLVSATDPDAIGTERGGIPIVGWWSTTCIAARQIDAWIQIGAITASGAVQVQFFPNTWRNFARSWIGGQTYLHAVNTSLTGLVVAEAEGLVEAQGMLPPWYCLPANSDSVLAQSACAYDFFTDTDGNATGDEAGYELQEIYNPSLTGAQNMFISSTRQFLGDTSIRFGGGAHTWP
jgi:hypothetical protein